MSLQHILDQGGVDWLEVTGDTYTYRSAGSGRVTAIKATVEFEVEVIDNEGMMVKHTMAYLPSDAVPSVGLGDIMTHQITRTRFKVQEKYEDHGTMQSLYVKREM